MTLNSGNCVLGAGGTPVDTHENSNQEQRGAGRGFLPSPSPQAGRSAYESPARIPIDSTEANINAEARDRRPE
jgi:hypothetical protein